MHTLGTRLVLVVWCSIVAIGCGSSSAGDGGPNGSNGTGASLDCAWLASDNCWKTTATSASSCLPPATETGVLSSDNKTCTYASGAVVTFGTPLVLPLPDNPTWDFTIANGGQTCLHYADTGSGFSLTVGSQTVDEAVSGSLGIQVRCPTGAFYSTSNAFELFSCGGDGGPAFGGLPGNAYSDSMTSVSLGLIGTSSTSSNELSLFNCEK